MQTVCVNAQLCAAPAREADRDHLDGFGDLLAGLFWSLAGAGYFEANSNWDRLKKHVGSVLGCIDADFCK